MTPAVPMPYRDTPSDAPARLWPWLLVAAALVVFRTLPFLWWGTLAFDADQAVVGLMAKHIAEFRALPVYQYGLPYLVIVTAYLTAPFMWVFGPTVFALKLPVLLMNVGVGVALLTAIVRAGLTPAAAALVCLPFLLTSAVATAGLMDALGMTIEPVAFVVMLWYARRAPVTFGVVAAVGFHVREFVAYGVAALVASDLLTGGLLDRDRRRHWTVAIVAALGCTALLSGAARYGSVRGPGTWLTTELEGNLATLGGAFCFSPRWAARNVVAVGASFLGVLGGAAPAPLRDVAVQSRVWQGAPGAWPALGLILFVLLARVVWRWRVVWASRRTPLVQLAMFLVLVGAQALLVYAVSRCGPIGLLTIRYALLGVFLLTGLTLLVWVTEPGGWPRYALGVVVITLAGLNGATHVRLWHEQMTRPIVSSRARLGPALEARGIRYARSDYWTAYYVDFMTEERVTVGAGTLSRVDVYERALTRHSAEVMEIRTDPCGSVPPIVPGFWVCRPGAP